MSTATASTFGLKSFKRGVHTPHRKFTETDPIQLYVPQSEIIVPMAQHIGAACEPIVQAQAGSNAGREDRGYRGVRFGPDSLVD